MGGAHAHWRRRCGVWLFDNRAQPDRRQGDLVLSFETRLAVEPGVHLSAVDHRLACVVAMPFPTGYWPSAGRAVVVSDAIPRPVGRNAVVHRDAGPGAGFCQRLPVRFSFVADHFQMQPSLGVIALLSAGATLLTQRRGMTRTLAAVLAVLVVGTAATLTFRQSHEYVDGETLYRTTLRSNPSSPMVRNNLGELLRKRAGVVNPDRRLLEEAESQFREACGSAGRLPAGPQQPGDHVTGARSIR